MLVHWPLNLERHKESSFNDLTQIWSFSDPSVTLKWLFYFGFIHSVTKVTTTSPHLCDVIYWWSLIGQWIWWEWHRRRIKRKSWKSAKVKDGDHEACGLHQQDQIQGPRIGVSRSGMVIKTSNLGVFTVFFHAQLLNLKAWEAGWPPKRWHKLTFSLYWGLNVSC